MNKAFSNFTWKNLPSIDTPLNQTNLNKVNNGLNEVDNRVVAMDTSKANVSDLLTDVVNVAYNTTTGVWTFTRRNGTTITFDQNVEKIPVSFSMSPQGVITMTTADGTKYTCDVATLIKTYTFNTSTDVRFNTATDSSGNKTITAYIVNGSITAEKLNPNYLAQIVTQVSTAQAAANSALTSANSAEADRLLAQSYAIGNSGVRSGEDTDNAKYYKEQAATSATTATQMKNQVQTLHDDTVVKHDNVVTLKAETEQLFNDAADIVDDILQNAFDEVSPDVYIDLDTGELMYRAGKFNLMIDETLNSPTIGELLWEVTA